MNGCWIVNASPVIALAKVGQLSLIERIANEILLPEAVAIEILEGPETDPARLAIENGWGRRASAQTIRFDLLEWALGAGETAVLALGLERQTCTVVLDDAAARNCAKVCGLPLIGTLGVILLAKRKGLIAAASPILCDVRSAGLHLDDRTIRVALERLGESW